MNPLQEQGRPRAPAASDSLALSPTAIRPGARQRRRPDAEIVYGGEVSFEPPCFATYSIPSSPRPSSRHAPNGICGCPESASPYCDVRRFDDRCPTSNLAFYQCCEGLLASPLFARNVAAKVGHALAYVLVIQCLVECIRERVENRLRYALRPKQRPPRQRLKFRQAGLYCSWDIW